MDVSENRGTPKWMVYFMENPIKHGMIWGENPLFLETPRKSAPKSGDIFLKFHEITPGLVESLGFFFQIVRFTGLHPGRLTWNIQITHLERKMIFQASMIMFYVNLPGCTENFGSISR